MTSFPDGTWILDPATTQLEVSVKNFGFRTVVGTLAITSGSIEIAQGDVIGVTVSADASSYATGNAKRDEHVRSADFLDAENHQRIGFTATSARSAGSGYQLDGTVQIKGNESPLTLSVSGLDVADDKASFSATGTAARNELGIDKMPSLMIGNELTLAISATAQPS